MCADKTVRERRVPRPDAFHGFFEELGVPPDALSVPLGLDAVHDMEECHFHVTGANLREKKVVSMAHSFMSEGTEMKETYNVSLMTLLKLRCFVLNLTILI